MIRGLYGIADSGFGDPEAIAADLFEGGCRLVQVRCKGWAVDDVLRVSRAVVRRARPIGAIVIVNDHPEVAVEADAHGVHVGQLDSAVAEVRRIVGNRIIGRSTNDPEQIRTALEGADYVAFGPVYATANAGRPQTVRGVEGLRAARAIVPARVPLVAIGGITAERMPEIRACGADAWAVIGAICARNDRVAATRALLG